MDDDKELNVNLLDALYMIRRAWMNVKQSTISNCFRHAGFATPKIDTCSNELNDESESDMESWSLS